MNTSNIFDTHGDISIIGKLADETLALLKDYPVLLLKGNLGSGKTTFCQTLLNKAGIQDAVTSPSFNLVSEYRLKDGSMFYHFDLYRIKFIEELDEIGFYEYIDSGAICIIEWPEIVEKNMHAPYLCLNIFHQENGRRYLLSLNE